MVGGRDLLDKYDVFQCFNHVTGDLIWQHLYPAAGNLDYGNSPRATPLIDSGLVYTLGAFGDVSCIELDSGAVFWSRNIATEFSAKRLNWGYAGSPLIANETLIVQPGGPQASVVGLDLDTGETLWTSPGAQSGYSSFVAGTFGGIEQFIGYDAESLGGWDSKTGERLWKMVPPYAGDFNIPTVVPIEQDLLVTSENNGTRRYQFRFDGTLNPDPIAVNEDLAPDTHSPVISGGKIHGIWNELYGLNIESLKTEHAIPESAFSEYGSLIASDSRLLCLNQHAELLLITTDTDQPNIVNKIKLSEERDYTLSHPAVAGNYLFVRIGRELRKYSLQ